MLRTWLIVVVAILVVLPLGAAGEPQTQLEVTANYCFRGRIGSPENVWIGVYDVSKVPHLLGSIQKVDRTDGISVDPSTGMDLVDSLQEEAKSTPGLYRSPKPFPNQKRTVKVPTVKHMLVVVFGYGEGQLTMFAHREIEPKPGGVADVTLSFYSVGCQR